MICYPVILCVSVDKGALTEITANMAVYLCGEKYYCVFIRYLYGLYGSRRLNSAPEEVESEVT